MKKIPCYEERYSFAMTRMSEVNTTRNSNCVTQNIYKDGLDSMFVPAHFIGLECPKVKVHFSNVDLPRVSAVNLSLVLRKPVFGVSDQVRHKPGCQTTEDS